MTADPVLLPAVLVAVAVLLVGAAAIMILRVNTAGRIQERVLVSTGMRSHDAEDEAGNPFVGAIAGVLRRLGERVRRNSRFYSDDDIASLEIAIMASGLNAARVLPVVLGGKLLLTALVPVGALLYGFAAGLNLQQFILVGALALPVGLLGPDWVLFFVRRPYVAALRRGLPDALDLLVVCTEAGMGLEAALEHVATEIARSNPAISVAMTKLLDELRVLPDRRQAFTNFGRRSGVDSFRRLATMLGQTLQYGTPLGQALRSVAVDLRRERMTALEAKCARLPAMLVLPLIIFIMPALFIVLAGSPMLRVLDSLRKMGHS